MSESAEGVGDGRQPDESVLGHPSTTREAPSREVCYRGATLEDVPAFVELVNVVAEYDDTDETCSEETVSHQWTREWFDPKRHVVLAVAQGRASGAEELLGWAEVHVADFALDGALKAYLGGAVLPAARGRGIGTELLARIDERARGLLRLKDPAMPQLLEGWGRQGDSDSAELLRDAGFEVVRHFHDMRVELRKGGGELEPSKLVEEGAPDQRGRSAVLRRFDPLRDREGTRRAHNEAFRDHWGSTERSAEKWDGFIDSPSFRPQYSWIAVDPALDAADDSEGVESYVLVEEWDPGELYVALVGTRRRARGRHLASALLNAVLRDAEAAGARTVDLGVDSSSPTGANGVYERAGFSVIRSGVAIHRRLEAGEEQGRS